jgi:N-acetylglutamate synthase-like GNAT family acetyltransferase
MKILIEVNLLDIEPNDIYKPNSGWFSKAGFIDIPETNLPLLANTEGIQMYRFKYIGQLHNEIPRP